MWLTVVLVFTLCFPPQTSSSGPTVRRGGGAHAPHSDHGRGGSRLQGEIAPGLSEVTGPHPVLSRLGGVWSWGEELGSGQWNSKPGTGGRFPLQPAGPVGSKSSGTALSSVPSLGHHSKGCWDLPSPLLGSRSLGGTVMCSPSQSRPQQVPLPEY